MSEVFNYSPEELVDLPRPQRRAQITWASEIEPEPVVWAWEDNGEGRIPSGSLSVAAGREGTGKSSFGIWLAAQIAAGALPGSFHAQPRRVFYVAVEDSWKHTLVPRLIAAGADRSMVGRFEVVNDIDEQVEMSLPADNNLLEEAIVQNDVGLVVIDPLMSVIGARIDTHREREVRTALDPLARIADRTGAVVLGIAHFNKSSSGDPASLITGSGAFKNVPRSVFGFARDEDDENGGRILSQVKNSLGRDDLPNLAYRIDSALVETPKGPAVTGRFTLLGESDKSVSDVLRAGFSGDAEDRNEAQQFVLDYLLERTPPEAPAGDVLKAGRAAGFSDQSSKDARRRSKNPRILSAKSDFGGGWVWQVSTQGGTEGSEGVRDQDSATTATYAPPSPDPAPQKQGRDTTCAACGNVLHQGSCVRCQVEGRRSA
ncbi:AAA family ATPase [Brevibacterium ihuae]|uniref:AAA family ATPase n=1 Tax=Brevibacterium ihuae TaxID=1631743 RepID=UPI000C76E22F|nr:AAA family ATPase [Brevibacterium ihuae]